MAAHIVSEPILGPPLYPSVHNLKTVNLSLTSLTFCETGLKLPGRFTHCQNGEAVRWTERRGENLT